jgi:hypothetical protein
MFFSYVSYQKLTGRLHQEIICILKWKEVQI